MYIINTIEDMADIDRGNLAPIDIFNWEEYEYRPNAYARLCFIKNKGFGLKLWAEESPIATYTEPNSSVCEDSCLEFFADFKPQLDKGYINFEANANGCLLAQFGRVDENRPFLSDMGIENPEVKPFKEEKCWGYTMFISLELLEKTFGSRDFKNGDKITASFYKCGDKTGKKHYGSYVKIDWEYPSFHRPQFFAEMMIGE